MEIIDLFAQAPRAPRAPSSRAGRPPAVMWSRGGREGREVGLPVDHDLTEEETASVLGVTRQTIRNMRVGYTNAYGSYPPKLEKNDQWYKFRESKRSPVLFRLGWVNKMLEMQRTQAVTTNN